MEMSGSSVFGKVGESFYVSTYDMNGISTGKEYKITINRDGTLKKQKLKGYNKKGKAIF